MHVCVHVSARVSLCVSGDTGAQGWGLLESPGCSRNPPASGQRPARLEHTATRPSVLRADPAPWPAPQGTRGGLGKGQGSRGAGLSGTFFLVLPGRAASGDAVAQAPSNASAGTGPGLCLPRSPSMAGAVGRGLWRSGLWTRPREALDTGCSSGVRRHRRCWSLLVAPAPGTRLRPDQAPCPLARHAQRGGGSPRQGLPRARPCRKDGSAGWSPCPGGGRGRGLPQDLPLQETGFPGNYHEHRGFASRLTSQGSGVRARPSWVLQGPRRRRGPPGLRPSELPGGRRPGAAGRLLPLTWALPLGPASGEGGPPHSQPESIGSCRGEPRGPLIRPGPPGHSPFR